MSFFLFHNVQNQLISYRKQTRYSLLGEQKQNTASIPPSKHNSEHYRTQAVFANSSRCLPSTILLDRSIRSLRWSIKNRHTSAVPRWAMACSISAFARRLHCEARSSDFSSSCCNVRSEHSSRYSKGGSWPIRFSPGSYLAHWDKLLRRMAGMVTLVGAAGQNFESC